MYSPTTATHSDITPPDAFLALMTGPDYLSGYRLDRLVASLNYRFRMSLAEQLNSLGVQAEASKYLHDCYHWHRDGRFAATRLVLYDEDPTILRVRACHSFLLPCRRIDGKSIWEYPRYIDEIEISFLPGDYRELTEWLPHLVACATGHDVDVPEPPLDLDLCACLHARYAWTLRADYVYALAVERRRAARERRRRIRATRK